MAVAELSEARHAFADGEAELESGNFENAIWSFQKAQQLFSKDGDEIGTLQALSQCIAAHIAKGDTEGALRMANDKRSQFEAKQNINGETCMLEQIINAQVKNKDLAAAVKTTQNALDRFKQYEKLGTETKAQQAFMWLAKGQAHLGQEQLADAMEAAEVAGSMFSDLGEYDHESLAVKLYNAAHDADGKITYWHTNQHQFYLGIRIAGIDYGPRYRNVHPAFEPYGQARGACISRLQLTTDEAEEWEHGTGYHSGMIDAGAHASFSVGQRPENVAKYQAEQAAIAADPDRPPEGPNIPFLMEYANFRRRNGVPDMYINQYSNPDPTKNGGNTYMFHG